MLLEGLGQLHFRRDFIVIHELLDARNVLRQFILGSMSVLTLTLRQVAHYLRQLHFAKFVQLLGFEHPALYLPDGLRVDLHVLVVDVLCLDAVSAKMFSGATVPRVNFQVMLAAHCISL